MKDLLALSEYFQEELKKEKKKFFWYLRPSTDRLMKDWRKVIDMLEEHEDRPTPLNKR